MIFFFIIPIWFLFYLKFITISQIALLTIIRQFSTLFLELPTGALADIWGKRRTLILSYSLYAISLIATPFGATFGYFVIFEIVRGVAKALLSGAFEALAYDSLKDINEEGYYPTLIGRINTISWIALILAGLGGGVLFDIDFRLPYIITGILHIVCLIMLILYIKEPLIDTEKYSARKYFRQTYQGISELFKNYKTSIIVPHTCNNFSGILLSFRVNWPCSSRSI
ncbi:MAG TPA: MFS transporter [Candidatus Dojkabacteria bacterium]|nr:MFS transporter [Candidatus Dojkabacteria bacterium]HQF36374.1 MFS transporter [Candidatus Dojkabacteria bacterium]